MDNKRVADQVSDIGPLDWRISIVDKSGRPSPEFQRRWNANRANTSLIGTITFGTGAPSGTPGDGAEYIDISTTPYSFYVGNGGTWHLLSPVFAANPTAVAKDTAINGTAATFMRSDAAPAVQKGLSTQFGIVKVDGTTISSTGGIISGAAPANPTATAKDTAVNGSAATFMRSDAAPAVQKASSSQFGIVKVDGTTITESGGVISASGGGGGGGGMTKIASVVASGTPSTITFASIPGSYTDLFITFSGRSSAAAGSCAVRINFNSDTGANYSSDRETRFGGVVYNNGAYAEIGAITAASTAANQVGSGHTTICAYTNTTFYKGYTGVSNGFDGGGPTPVSMYTGGVWNSTAAINRIDITLSSGNWENGSVITLYGLG